jgi:hypothetical protein
MTDINHRRSNRKPVNQRYNRLDYRNGYAVPDNKQGVHAVQAQIDEQKAEYEALGITNVVFPKAHTGSQRVGQTDYLDKSMHGWSRKSELADRTVFGGIGNDYCNGHRGMAKAVKGAKKFVRTRIRFHENAATRKLLQESSDNEV